MRIKLIGSVIAGAALVVVQVQAQLVNGSFETLTVPGVSVKNGFNGTVPGWTGPTAANSGVDTPLDIKAPGAEDGVNAAFFMNQDGYAEQTSGTVIGGSGGYDLNFWTMDIDTYNGTWSGAGIGVIAVEVYAGTDATPIYGEVDFNLGPSSNGVTPGTWVYQGLHINAADIPNADIGENLGIKIWNNSTDVAGSWIYVDNVTLAVPEPATMALFGLGSLALLAFRRRA